MERPRPQSVVLPRHVIPDVVDRLSKRARFCKLLEQPLAVYVLLAAVLNLPGLLCAGIGVASKEVREVACSLS